MSRPTKAPERNAGAFLGPDVLLPVPMRTLSDEYHDAPTEPVDSDRVPEPEAKGAIGRLVDRVTAALGRR